MVTGLGLGITASSYFEPAVVGRDALSLTTFGNAQIDTANSKIGGSSGLFDGTGDYLVIENNSVLSLNDFTVECWFRVTNSAAALIPLVQIGNFLFYIGQDGGSPVFAIFQGGSNRLLSSAVTINNNTWYHVAFTRSGSSMTCYFGGTSVGTGTFGTQITQGTNYIGRYSTYYLSGQLDELRISDTARYTTGFTPSTSAFENDADTVLLTHMDGPDATTAFYDDNGASASLVLDGSGDYIKSTINSSAFGFGTGDFTMEAWVYLSSTSGLRPVICCREGALTGNYSNVLAIYGAKVAWSNGAAFLQGATTLSTNTWYHVAVTRSSGTLKLWLNGSQDYSSTQTVNVGTGVRPIAIGSFDSGGDAFYGNIDLARISNTARYSTTFTPDVDLDTDANTKLLMKFDGYPDGAVVFGDTSGTNLAFNAFGSAQIDTDNFKD